MLKHLFSNLRLVVIICTLATPSLSLGNPSDAVSLRDLERRIFAEEGNNEEQFTRYTRLLNRKGRLIDIGIFERLLDRMLRGQGSELDVIQFDAALLNITRYSHHYGLQGTHFQPDGNVSRFSSAIQYLLSHDSGRRVHAIQWMHIMMLDSRFYRLMGNFVGMVLNRVIDLNRQDAVEALARQLRDRINGQEMAPFLLEVIQNSGDTMFEWRHIAVASLGKERLASYPIIRVLVDAALTERDFTMRYEAITALAKIALVDRSLISTIAGFLNDSHWFVRLHVADILLTLSPEQFHLTIPVLENVKKESFRNRFRFRARIRGIKKKLAAAQKQQSLLSVMGKVHGLVTGIDSKRGTITEVEMTLLSRTLAKAYVTQLKERTKVKTLSSGSDLFREIAKKQGISDEVLRVMTSEVFAQELAKRKGVFSGLTVRGMTRLFARHMRKALK